MNNKDAETFILEKEIEKEKKELVMMEKNAEMEKANYAEYLKGIDFSKNKELFFGVTKTDRLEKCNIFKRLWFKFKNLFV